MSFVHLHFHTSYSFLDGYNPIKKAVNRIVELGMDACAITDHNHLGGCIEFQAECKARGIKPLLGMEGYYTEKMNELAKPIDERKKDALELAIADGAIDAGDAAKMKASALKEIIAPYMYDTHAYHILFIAKNLTGWHNLVKLQSEAARLCTFNGRYHCDKDLLRKYHEGIICTTACIGSFPSKMIQKGEYDRALSYILDMKDIFGDDFYLEIQPLNIEEQRITNLAYLDLAEEYDINTVATNDVHWTYKEDYDDHDTLLCIGTGRRKHDLDRMKYSDDFWIKSSEEMIQSFEEQSSYIVDTDQEKYAEFYAEAVERTHEIADKVDENIPLGSPKPLFSNVKVPHGFNPTQYLSLLAWKGLYSYLAQHPECDKAMYEARLNEELNIICPKGFAPYMLAVREYVTWANENNCPTGPGRGSAAGSLVLFSIGVTKIIDPIKYGLWFSRFLTKDRMAPPDIDIDFAWSHRDDVVHHLEDYYGKEYVAHIGTYTQEGVKSGITDIGRVLDIPLPEVKSITKKISEIVGGDAVPVKFKDLDKMKKGDENERKNWEAFNELEEDHEELFRLARAFEGTPRNTGVHASGILVTPVPVSDIAPVIYSKDGTAITLYTGPQLEEFNFIKYDLLGLKTIDIIQKTIHNIDKTMDMEDLYETAAIDDKKVYKYISNKNTDAVFQLGSNMMKGLIDDIKPTEFNDIVAINALGRPGPLTAGFNTMYANGKNGGEIEYPIRDCEDILNETYGVIAYQEQLMAVSKKVSGFDDTQADSITRKVTAKKKKKLFPMMIRSHIFGKKNCEGPAGWENDDNAPWYDPEGHYGGEIEGAVANGYSVEEMKEYFESIMGFASYAFNKSHAACYSYMSYLCAWLKLNYPTQFMAAVLTMADEKKLPGLVDICDKMNLKISVPDINLSETDFTPNGHTILYGLSAVKGVGDKAIPDILANRPYDDVTDAVSKIPKKAFNKRIGKALIEAGAFDAINDNRMEVMNQYFDVRKDKDERFHPEFYDKRACMEFEQESLGAYVTYKPWWDTVAANSKVEVTGQIISIREQVDKRGGLMAFVSIRANDCVFDGLIFASKYGKINDLFNNNYYLTVSGKKNDKGTFIINNAKVAEESEKQTA